MRKWQVTLMIHDDGLADDTGEIKGKYFTEKEIKQAIKGTDTAGLTTKITKIEKIQ